MPELRDAFAKLFRPQVVAVVGASSSAMTPGNEFIRHCQAMGFKGRIVPVHPSAAEIEGLPAAKSIEEIGAVVDFVYIAVRADSVAGVLESCKGRARFAQVMSSGFGETDEGRALETRLVEQARTSGVRVLGPNCLGIYSPRGGLSFIAGAPTEPGSVGVITQSGGLGADVILRGRTRGIRFSGLVTLGNSADVTPAELVEHFLHDADTRVIGVYAEDIKDGRRFFEALRASEARKPVVVLLGGQTSQGQRAAASHTGSLASGIEIWRGVAEQTGIVIVETLDQFLDVLLAFQALEPGARGDGNRCVLFGNGGGTSVLAADAFSKRKLDVIPITGVALQALEALKLPPGTSISNPIDTPTLTLRKEDGRIAEKILDIIIAQVKPDAVVMHLNLPMFMNSADQRTDFLQNIVLAMIRTRARHKGAQTQFMLVLRSDGSEPCETRRREFRGEAIAQGIPVFDELTNAGDALAGMSFFQRHRRKGNHVRAQAGRAHSTS